MLTFLKSNRAKNTCKNEEPLFDENGEKDLKEETKMEENKNLNNEAGVNEMATGDKPKVGIIAMIWNGTKWVVSKTWKFAVGAVGALAIERVFDHFAGGEDGETQDDSATEESAE